MAPERVKRRLAAILAADMVGYSRLMQVDEEGTLSRQKAHRKELLDPAVDRHGGRIFHVAGDGVLVEFPSAVDAVRCAVEVQQSVAELESEVPEDRRIAYRVGINLGEIVLDDENVVGDGVNIAARLEALAEPGGICVSEVVFKNVKGKLDVGFADLGPRKVKNIDEPVSTYEVRLDPLTADPRVGSNRRSSWRRSINAIAGVARGLRKDRTRAARPARRQSTEPKPAHPEKPSVAVLPLANMSGDPEQAYFADGITEDIITDLSKISGLFVIARTSTLAYKDEVADVRRIARDLGVRYVVEGSVRKAADTVRVTVQLIDAATGNHLWAERYDRPLADVFAIQSEIAQSVASALEVALTPDERKRVARKYAPKPDAYDAYLRGRATFLPPTAKNLADGKALYERAIELDPKFAGGYAGLALVHALNFVIGHSAMSDDDMDTAVRLAEKAIEVDDQSTHGYFSLAFARLYSRQYDEAEATLNMALERAPQDADTRGTYANVLHFLGAPAEAIELAQEARRKSPGDPRWTFFLGAAYRAAGDYENAIEMLELHRRILGITDHNPGLQLAAAYMQSGQEKKARETVQDVLKTAPHFNMEIAERGAPYRKREDLEPYLEALRQAGLPES